MNAILMPHGGPESYDKKEFDWLAQYFANRGYLVIQPQFRGSTGFGANFTLKGRGEWGRKMQNDLTDAITHLVKEKVINKNHLCIVGSSYGGYAALAGAAFTSDLYQCAVSINGVSDSKEMISNEESQNGDDHWVVSYWQEVIAHGALLDDFFEKISPINYVKNIKIPVLLIHGERDKVVPIEQSEDMFDELEDEDKNVVFIELVEDEGHHLTSSKARVEILKALEAFINKHI